MRKEEIRKKRRRRVRGREKNLKLLRIASAFSLLAFPPTFSPRFVSFYLSRSSSPSISHYTSISPFNPSLAVPICLAICSSYFSLVSRALFTRRIPPSLPPCPLFTPLSEELLLRSPSREDSSSCPRVRVLFVAGRRKGDREGKGGGANTHERSMHPRRRKLIDRLRLRFSHGQSS